MQHDAVARQQLCHKGHARHSLHQPIERAAPRLLSGNCEIQAWSKQPETCTITTDLIHHASAIHQLLSTLAVLTCCVSIRPHAEYKREKEKLSPLDANANRRDQKKKKNPLGTKHHLLSQNTTSLERSDDYIVTERISGE